MLGLKLNHVSKRGYWWTSRYWLFETSRLSCHVTVIKCSGCSVCYYVIHWIACLNSLWPRATIWRHGSESTLVQVIVCCLTAPSHYLNQYCFFSSMNFVGHMRAISQKLHMISICKMCSKITAASHRGQWVEIPNFIKKCSLSHRVTCVFMLHWLNIIIYKDRAIMTS